MGPLLPGSTVGVLGSGQLGRMLALAAARMGYRVEVFSPARDTPAGRVAFRETTASYEDEEALREFARRVGAVTIEFENIPDRALRVLEETVPVRPGPEVLYHTQDRGREKAFLARHGIPHAATEFVPAPGDLDAAVARIGFPAVLKTAGFGYDGKGQIALEGRADLEAGREQLASGPGVLERHVEFDREVSVVVARGADGEVRTFGPIENRHVRRILDLSSVPAAASSRTGVAAREIATLVAESLDLVGVLCVEFFEMPSGELLVNEIAPRPHNSGHLTIEACPASQFEQQLRALCGLPLGEFEPVRPAAMANLMGDLWQGGDPRWQALLSHGGVALHLYGKDAARPGRKMGHLTALARSSEEAVERVESARAALLGVASQSRRT